MKQRPQARRRAHELYRYAHARSCPPRAPRMHCRRPPAPSAWRPWRIRAAARLRCDRDKSCDVPCGLRSHPCAFDRTRAAEHPVLENIGERYRREKHLDLPAQFFPEIVRETASGAAETTFRTVGTAARRLDRLIDGNDDVGN